MKWEGEAFWLHLPSQGCFNGCLWQLSWEGVSLEEKTKSNCGRVCRILIIFEKKLIV